MVDATELICSEPLSPILLAHSTSPLRLDFIIKPSEYAKELLLSKTNLIPYQIVGHTPITMIVPDEDIIFIDSHSTHPQGFNIGDKSYLFWNENRFEILNFIDL